MEMNPRRSFVVPSGNLPRRPAVASFIWLSLQARTDRSGRLKLSAETNRGFAGCMNLAERNIRPADGELEERIAALGPWFHNMDLGGVWTAPDHFLGDYPGVKFRRFAPHLPAQLSGKSVLDIGCNAGFYSIEMKRRGAGRVLAVDSDDRYLAQARFASETLGFDDIEFAKLDVYDVGALGERFDLVIFMGVLYHLRHPLLALDLIREHVAGDMMLFQSMQRGSKQVLPVEENYDFNATEHFLESGYPKLHFIEQRYADDWTNWWVPNRACTEAMLRASGFAIEKRVEDEVYLCRTAERPYAQYGPAAVYPARDPGILGGA
jgi:tRNA (mo5U34)-methyltransferase